MSGPYGYVAEWGVCVGRGMVNSKASGKRTGCLWRAQWGSKCARVSGVGQKLAGDKWGRGVGR